MSNFFHTVVDEYAELISFFIAISLIQNIVLTTGFGSSMMLRVVRQPKGIWLFSAILTVFSVLTALIVYPLDKLCGTAITNFWRPLMIVGVAAILYVVAVLILRRWFATFYAKVSRILPLAAFNNLVVGTALIANNQFTANLGGSIGLSIGACLGFALLTWMTAEGIERLDNPDMPAAFRGMPATLIYIGILALALLGFSSSFSLI